MNATIASMATVDRARKHEPRATLIAEEGLSLSIGDHLVEVGFDRSVPSDVLSNALAMIGFSEAILDQSLRVPEDDQAEEWGAGSASNLPIYRARFVGRLKRAAKLAPHPNGLVTWIYARKLALDPFEKPTLARMRAARFLRGVEYEAVAASRIRAHPTRSSTARALRSIGLEPSKVCCLRRNQKSMEGFEAHHWLVVGRWTKSDSYVTGEEPIYLDRVAMVRPGGSS